MSRWEKSTLEILFSLKTFLIRRKFEASVDDNDVVDAGFKNDDDNVKKNRFTQPRLQNGNKSCLAPEG